MARVLGPAHAVPLFRGSVRDASVLTGRVQDTARGGVAWRKWPACREAASTVSVGELTKDMNSEALLLLLPLLLLLLRLSILLVLLLLGLSLTRTP